MSFGYDREVGIHPLVPSTLEDIDLGVALFQKFLCHPGTRAFALSGSVENQGLVFWVPVHP